MSSDPALAAEIGAQFEHILVDEYQDTNVLQAEILKGLKPSGEGLTVVGDDAQAIYSFRAATIENIVGFPDRFGNARTVVLEENYRSTQPVLDAANALIGKNLRSRKGKGPKPRYVTVADDEAQAQYVVRQVLEGRERGVLLRRQAVLFRSSHHSDVLELELVRRNIPYVKYGGLKFLEAAHVKDLLAVLRWADNPKNRVAAFRALQLQSGVGPAGAERVFTRFEANGFSWNSLRTGSPELDSLFLFLGNSPWEGQVQRVREWYAPHLERLYDAAQVRAGDLLQMERIATSFQTGKASSRKWPWTRRARPATCPARRTSTRTISCFPPSTRPRARNGTRCSCSTSPTATSPRSSPPGARSSSRRSGGSSTSP
jgi:DNA helicase-2/ATP-dependent DNA helicase PcrA